MSSFSRGVQDLNWADLYPQIRPAMRLDLGKITPLKHWFQGPQNLYGRNGKFHATFKSGREKRRFSVPLLNTWCHQIDFPKSKLNTELYIFCCTGRGKSTKLHRFAPILLKNFPAVTPPNSHNCEGACPSPRRASTAPLFWSFHGPWLVLYSLSQITQH